MIRINQESDLIGKLQEDIDNTEKPIRILAGHLPLLYPHDNPDSRQAELGVHRWGEFSSYTFDIGGRLVKYCQENGKSAQIIILVDDDDELRRDENGKRRDKNRIKSARKRFYSNAQLPREYLEILQKYGLDESCLVHIGNIDGGTTPLISERTVKSQAEKSGIVAPNECSKAYKVLLMSGQIFDNQRNHLISFIPGQCKGNICAGVLDENEIPFDSSHIFFPNAKKMGGLVLENGLHVQRFAPWTREMIFQAGLDYVQTKYREIIATAQYDK